MPIELTSTSRLLVLTGAGISVASGLRPYRGPGGLWTDNPEIERESASPELRHRPDRIWELFGPLREEARRARPNAAHEALTRVQQESGCAAITLVTQNVDGLHQRSGFQNVAELHGSILRSRCTQCDLPPFDDPETGPRPCPACGQPLRPDIVLFGERIPDEPALTAHGAVLGCDIFLAVGTSGGVAPASSLVQRADTYGAATLLVNLEPMRPPNPAFHREILGKAEEILPDLFTWPTRGAESPSGRPPDQVS